MAESYTIEGKPSFILAQKHRALKKDLRWNREEKEALDTKKKEQKK